MDLEEAYREMVLIRKFEKTILDLFSEGVLMGTTHPYVGQEAIAVGIINVLQQDDVITGNHRSHGHYLTYTDDVESLMKELMGKEGGTCGGRGGSQHLHKNNFYTNGIAGGMIPVATGMAFSEKKKDQNNVVVAFLGDGMLGHGPVYEAMNLASLWGLPILYVVEDNQYAMSTHKDEAIAGKISTRGEAFGLNVRELSKNDVREVHDTATQEVKKVRNNQKPRMLICHTYRFLGHSKSDDRDYRSRKEEEDWRSKDPIDLLKKEIDKEKRKEIEKNTKNRIENAVKKAKEAPQP